MVLQAEAFLNDGAVEGAFVTKTGEIIFGDLWLEDKEISVAVRVSEKQYQVYCSHCDGGVCSHIATLILCYQKNPESFFIQEKYPDEDFLMSSRKFSLNLKTSKSTSFGLSKRKKKAMLTGLEMAQQLITQLFEGGSGIGNSHEVSRVKEQVQRLDEYYLPGLKIMLISLIEELLIKKPDEQFLYELEKLNCVIKKSIDELEEVQESLPFTVLHTLRGHIWKYKELEHFSRPFDGRLLQFFFTVNENLIAERLEEIGYWIDVKTGEIFYTANYRPFKALRYIPEDDTIFDVLEAKGIVRYPGDLTPRIRWKSVQHTQPISVDFQSILQKAEDFNVATGKSIKVFLRDKPFENPYVKLIKFEDIFNTSSGISISTGDLLIPLKECPESDVLICLSEGDLTGSAVFLEFYINFRKNLIEAKPLSLVLKDKILRLWI